MVTNNDPATASRSPDHAPDRVPRTRTCGRQSPAPEKASRDPRGARVSAQLGHGSKNHCVEKDEKRREGED